MRRMSHRSWSVWVLSALLLLGVAAACGGDDNSVGDTQPPVVPETPAASDQARAGTNGEAVEGFTFADDDLCEWITADEVAGFFASVYDWDGTVEVPDMTDAEPDECRWRLTSTTGGEFYELHAGNADPGVLLPVEVIEFDGGSVGTPGEAVSGHPALSEGVVVQSAGWGVYSFWVPPGDDYLALALTRDTGAGDSGVDSVTDEQALADSQARFFAVADQLLQELGWVS